VPAGTWTVHISAAADRDFEGILDWTTEHFGEIQARSYERMLTETLQSLRNGPTVRTARSLNKPGQDILRLPVKRGSRRSRHIIFFRIMNYGSRELEVLRILHDSMDFARHLSKEND
jgi:toxin ParE1/3/4